MFISHSGLYYKIKDPYTKVTDKWSDEMKDYVSKCMQRDAKDRWTIDQLLAHPIFDDIDSCKQGWIEEYAKRFP